MASINEGFLRLENDYLFSRVSEILEKYKKNNPNAKIINLSIGDVSLPLTKTVINAMNNATYEMSNKETFRGYGIVQGYDFLIEKILDIEYKKRKVIFDKNEIFIGAGTKGDLAGIAELFSNTNKIAITDPVYPAYRDANIMLGRKNIVYLKANEENGFTPEIPNEHVDIIYLCSPNNPTGVTLNREELTAWVQYAKKEKAIIFYDSVYEAFIEDSELPHSIYEIEGAKDVAIEFRSYSKLAGFTGVRCSFVTIPKNLVCEDEKGNAIKINPIYKRRQSTKFGAAPYITQRAAEAIYTDEGQKEIYENIAYYKQNAKYIKEKLQNAGFTAYGGDNSPYIWLKVPKNITSWEYFELLLNKAEVVVTPGSGFGKCGEGYIRLTAFASHENTKEAVERIIKLGGN